MIQNDAVLIVGGGPLQVELIRTAQRLHLYTIVTDARADAPGLAIADEAHVLSTSDVVGHAALAAMLRDSHPCQLRGVVTAGADCAPSVAAAAEAAGLPGIPSEVAQRSHDKAQVRQALTDAGLQRYQPHWLHGPAHVTVETLQALPAAITFLGQEALQRGLVIKPLRERASRGVRLVAGWDEVPPALRTAAAYGPDVLVEERLSGTEHSAEMLLDGTAGVLWWNIVDRHFTYAEGLPIETGHTNPTCLTPSQCDAIQQMLLQAAAALGVSWGPFKADVMLTPEGPKILEATARLSGGYDCQGTSPLTGRHPLRTLLQLACGLPVESPGPAQGYAACAAILPDKVGVVAPLPGWHTLRHLDGIAAIYWMIQPNDVLMPVVHNAQRSGFVLAQADTYADAWQRAKDAADALAAAVEVAP